MSLVELAEAARDIDNRSVGTGIIKKTVVKDGDFVSATGIGGTDDIANPLAPPINISRISCRRIFRHVRAEYCGV